MYRTWYNGQICLIAFPEKLRQILTIAEAVFFQKVQALSVLFNILTSARNENNIRSKEKLSLFFFYTLAAISNKKKSEITQTEMHGLSASGLMRF